MDGLHIALAPLALFCLVSSITPGPNNLLLMRSGARFGVRRSAAHVLGIQLGCIGLLWLCWLGVDTLLMRLPGGFALLRWACFAYLLWLAAGILREARAHGTGAAADAPARAHASPATRPFLWYEATLFQLINPKAWMMAVTMASAFYGSQAPQAIDIALAAAAWMGIGTPSMLAWAAWGASIERVLRRPRERQVYACGMAAAVAATAGWMLH